MRRKPSQRTRDETGFHVYALMAAVEDVKEALKIGLEVGDDVHLC